jgi:hypothetical protein
MGANSRCAERKQQARDYRSNWNLHAIGHDNVEVGYCLVMIRHACAGPEGPVFRRASSLRLPEPRERDYAPRYRIRGTTMNKPNIAIALTAFLLGTPCLAADCFVPASAPTIAGMSVAAPEMLRPAVADPYCVNVQDFLARVRAPATGAAAAYVPLTKDDNTPWRFDMSQNGKRMTAAEFDAWMKAKGIRVATGKPGTAAAPTAAAAPDGAAPPPATTGGQ